MIDRQFYEGREQALVKHTFLDRYLRDALPKVSRFGTFAYVDLFAGPWTSRCPKYGDTSFGIALRQMAAAKVVQKSLGNDVRMVAHLVERDAHGELSEAVKFYGGVDEVRIYPGRAEDHAQEIHDRIAAGAFRFVAIDPKGLPDMGAFTQLVAAPNTEALINFMFEFANRFAHTDRLPALERWLTTLEGSADWKGQVAHLSGQAREKFITDLARGALKKMGQYDYAPAITVDEVLADRPLYKLIYLSRHPKGLKVFRDAQHDCVSLQASVRTGVKANARSERSRMDDLFRKPDEVDPGERSARSLREERQAAEKLADELINAAGEQGIYWERLWTLVLDQWLIKQSELGRLVGQWCNAGKIHIDDWTARRRVPHDGDKIILASSYAAR